MPSITHSRNKIARLAVAGKRVKVSAVRYAKLKEHFNIAIRAYIKAALTEVNRHVDTGMTAASFTSLIKKVGSKQKMGSGQPKMGAMIGTPGNWMYSGDTVKSEALGRTYGYEGKAFTINYGSVTRPVFSFNFSTTVFQFAFHEANEYKHSGNWGALTQGSIAMSASLQSKAGFGMPWTSGTAWSFTNG